MMSHSNTSSTTVGQVGAVTPKPDLEAQLEKEATASSERSRVQLPVTDLDVGIVGWDSQEDPKNPQNYTQRKKWTILALISAMTMISPLASSMFAPAVEYMAKEFNETNATVISLSVSIYLLGYTVCFIPRGHTRQLLVDGLTRAAALRRSGLFYSHR